MANAPDWERMEREALEFLEREDVPDVTPPDTLKHIMWVCCRYQTVERVLGAHHGYGRAWWHLTGAGRARLEELREKNENSSG